MSVFIWWVAYRFASSGGLFQPYLVINVTGWVQFEITFRYILSPLLPRIYSCRVSPSNQHINFYISIITSLPRRKKTGNGKANSQGVTTSSLPQKEDKEVKDCGDEILGFDLISYLLARLTQIIIYSVCYLLIVFKKSIFRRKLT